MFQVFDGEKPADREHCKGLTADCWANSKFETWEEAVIYADGWLGMYGPGKYEINKPYFYYGEKENPELRITIKEIL